MPRYKARFTFETNPDEAPIHVEGDKRVASSPYSNNLERKALKEAETWAEGLADSEGLTIVKVEVFKV